MRGSPALGQTPSVLLPRISSRASRRVRRRPHCCSWSGIEQSGSHAEVAPSATMEKPALRAADFRFDRTVSCEPASTRIYACTVSARGGSRRRARETRGRRKSGLGDDQPRCCLTPTAVSAVLLRSARAAVGSQRRTSSASAPWLQRRAVAASTSARCVSGEERAPVGSGLRAALVPPRAFAPARCRRHPRAMGTSSGRDRLCRTACRRAVLVGPP
jgi:hypothetical protein